MTRLQTQYRRGLLRAKQALNRRGVFYTYVSRIPEVRGQVTNADNRVDIEYRVKVLQSRKSRRRDAGRSLQTHELSFLMHGDLPFKPKPGDYVVDPYGKRLPVDDVRIIGPDAVPLLYRMRCIDG